MFARRKKGRKADTIRFTSEELNFLEGLDYSGEFDLPQEAHRLSQVYEHHRSGGNFVIQKVMGGRGIRSFDIMPLDHFPTQDEVEELVQKDYGGGTYSICPEGGPGRFMTYRIAGPSTFHPLGSPPKSAKQVANETMGRLAADYLEDLVDRGDPAAEHFIKAYIEKKYGVKFPEPPKEPSYEEELERDFLDQRPEYRDALVEARLRKKGVRLPKEKTEFDRIIEKIERTTRFKEVLAEFGRAGEPEPKPWHDLLQGLAAVAPELLKLAIELRAGSSQNTANPLSPVPQAEPEHVPQKAQGQIESGAAPTPVPPPQQPQTVQEGAQPAPDQAIPAPAVDPAVMKWLVALSREQFVKSVDWVWLELGIHGDPGRFVERLREKAQDQSIGHGGVLGCLMDPHVFLEAVSEAVDRLRGEPGKGEEYEVAVLVHKYLTETEEGRRWLIEAQAAVQVMVDQIQEAASSKGEAVQVRDAEAEDEEQRFRDDYFHADI